MIRDRLVPLARRALRRARLARAARGPDAPRPGRWVVILGVEHSGASWVREALLADPGVGRLPDPGELATDQLLRPASMREALTWGVEPVHYALDEADERAVDVARWLRQWAASLRPVGAPIAVEHSPANAVRARFLARHLPDLHVIRVIRDAPEAVAAIRAAAGPGAAPPIATLARHWARVNEILDRDLGALPHVLTLRFEELVADPIGAASVARAFAGTGPGPVPPVPPPAPAPSEAERAEVLALTAPIRARLGYAPPTRPTGAAPRP